MARCKALTVASAILFLITALHGVQLRATVVAQTDDDPREIVFLSGRPLNDALLELERRHGWVITYEDTFLEDPQEIWDVTSFRRDGKNEPKVLVPHNKQFEFKYRRDDTKRPDALIGSLLSKYSADGHPDSFRLLQEPPVYHVVPVSSRDTQSRSVLRASRLGVRISLPDRGPQTLDAFLDELLREVKRVNGASMSGTTFGVGLAPNNLFIRTTVRGGAKDEVARDVLTRALANTGQRVSWQLLCQPSPNFCLISFHVVSPPKS